MYKISENKWHILKFLVNWSWHDILNNLIVSARNIYGILVMWYAIAYTHKGDRGRVGIRQQTMNATIANNNKIDLLVLLTTRQLLNQGFTMAKLKSDNCDSFTVITMVIRYWIIYYLKLPRTCCVCRKRNPILALLMTYYHKWNMHCLRSGEPKFTLSVFVKIVLLNL